MKEVQVQSGFDDGADPAFRPDHIRASGRFVGVDRHIGRPGVEHTENGYVEVRGTGRHIDPHAVSCADAAGPEPAGKCLDLEFQFGVAQGHCAVVDGRCAGIGGNGLGQDVHKGALVGRAASVEDCCVCGNGGRIGNQPRGGGR